MDQPNIKINDSNWLKAAASTDFIKSPFNLQVYFRFPLVHHYFGYSVHTKFLFTFVRL